MTSPNGRPFRGLGPEERRAQRRQALLDAALESFATKGYANTAIEQLCQDAGVGYKGFYDEFENKEQLFIALYDTIGARLLPAVLPALGEEGSPAQRLRAVIAAYIEALMEDPRIAKVLFVTSAGVSETVDLHRRAAHRAFASFFSELYTTGVVADAPMSRTGHRHALAMGVTGGMGEIVVDYLLDADRGDVESLINALDDFVQTLLRGLAAPARLKPRARKRATR